MKPLMQEVCLGNKCQFQTEAQASASDMSHQKNTSTGKDLSHTQVFQCMTVIIHMVRFLHLHFLPEEEKTSTLISGRHIFFSDYF